MILNLSSIWNTIEILIYNLQKFESKLKHLILNFKDICDNDLETISDFKNLQ